MTDWQTIDTAPKGQRVLVWGTIPGWYHLERRIIAMYWPTHSLLVHDDYSQEDWVEVGPDDEPYMPADWYVDMDGFDPEMVIAVNCKPTHWMPLPDPPTL